MISLVVLTGIVGLMVAPGHLAPALAIAAVLCIALGAGAAGAINMWYDRDIDARMKRTATRPIPAGRIEPGPPLPMAWRSPPPPSSSWGWRPIGWPPALLALSIGFYVFVYTMWLKRRTSQNIVIGGAAGAFPPVIGWAAVTGNITLEPIILFAIIFFWTPPHFWALSLFAHADYERVGVPMLPVTHGREGRPASRSWSIRLSCFR
ncbi:heme o synthase [Dankookia sp. P2]|uniref:heme o synthase n=1 Tax=Dankookia sp. P2 TaxID=3423955 RepID=UPI003D665842